MRVSSLVRTLILRPTSSTASSFSTTSIAMTAAKTSTARTALDESAPDGAFKRVDASWRNWVKNDKDAEFPAEKDRYHLYVAYACPWAHRTLITRAVKGLGDVISVTVVHPTWQKTRPGQDEHTGWVFGQKDAEPFKNSAGNGGPIPAWFPDNEPDPFGGAKSIRDIYEAADDKDGKYSVPVLWDKQKKTIVSNESSEIIRMLNSEFNDYAKYKELDLYPEQLRSAIDEINSWVYPTINNGVYRCGFAQTQGAYDVAITELTESFDRIDEILQKSRFIAGDCFTEADIRLFVTLLRMEEVYSVYFKTNTRFVSRTPSILNYCRDIYQMPGVKETVSMEQIKAHYYTSHPKLNYYSIIPRGTDFEKLLQEPNDRETLSAT
ncbi:hypothetical protein MPSEU_000296500 [Mayamaea pseudoterrestris]|nr:hypothetical protein MPSEU_000296500 [Mayamaea pseudoterrestris]